MALDRYALRSITADTDRRTRREYRLLAARRGSQGRMDIAEAVIRAEGPGRIAAFAQLHSLTARVGREYAGIHVAIDDGLGNLTTGHQTPGDTTITGKNQIRLPAKGLRELGWERGDHLLVQVARGDLLVLMRRPTRWADAFAGKLGDVFADPEDTIAYLHEERRSWGED